MSENSVPISIGKAPVGADHTVRPAVASDARVIADLQYQALQDFVARNEPGEDDLLPPREILEQQWRESLSQPAPEGCATFVAIHGQSVGAFALAVPGEVIKAIPGKRDEIPVGTEIASLIVRSEFQRSGHASRLLSAIRDSLSTANLRLWIETDDEPRQRFVQSAGFAPAGVRRELRVGEKLVTEHLWWASVS